MKILLIDTCGATGSVALADTDLSLTIVASASLPGRTASERLVPMIKHLAEHAGITLPSLDAVAVVHGPGSFTGVRVGLSAAKGLCEALNVPLLAISRLAVLAHLAEPPIGASVHALLDAGRGEFYHGVYADGNCLRETLVTSEELHAALNLPEPKAGESDVGNAKQPRIVVVCEPAVAKTLAALTPLLLAEPTAENALPLALRRIQERAFDDTATIDANYLRRTDAEIFAKPSSSPTVASQPAGNTVR